MVLLRENQHYQLRAEPITRYAAPMNEPKPKIAIFADVQNIYYTSRDTFSRPVNYKLLWRDIERGGEIVHACAYAIHRGDDKQLKFQNALKHMGFSVKLKPYIQRSDGSSKGDWDVGIAVDMLEIAPSVDKVVLLSGDGDFDLLLEAVKRRFNVPCDVYSVKALTAKTLIDSASAFYPIDETKLI